jgi:hypothetical protein
LQILPLGFLEAASCDGNGALGHGRDRPIGSLGSRAMPRQTVVLGRSVRPAVSSARITRTPILIALAGLIPLLAGGIFYARWLQLFPQIEFRTWMWSGVDLKWYIVSAFTHQGSFSRSTPFFADSAIHSVCGESIRCINGPGFLTILLTANLLFWLIVRLTKAIFAAVLATTLWLFSVPVLDAFAWQATMGDRLAALFGLATIHVTISAMRAIARSATRARIVLANACVLVPTILTYNSKEISWLLLPSLGLLAFALTDRWTASAILRRASVLIAPAGYAAFRTIETFIEVAESSAANSLDFGGHPLENARQYGAFLANRLNPDTLTYALAAVLVLAVLASLPRYRRAGTETRSQLRIMWWAALTLIGGLVLCLFTPYPGAYLLVLPSPFLWIALVALWRSVPQPGRGLKPLAGIALAAAGTAVMLIGLNSSYPPYRELLTWSRNFRRSIPVIAANVPLGAHIDFVIGGAPFLTYRFVGDDGQRVVDPFLYYKTGAALPVRTLVEYENRMENVQNVDPGFRGYSIVLGADLNVADILHGERVVYQEPSGA